MHASLLNLPGGKEGKWELTQVPADGNCMLHAFTHSCREQGIADAVRQGTERIDGVFDANVVRRDVAHWISVNQPTFRKHFLFGIEDEHVAVEAQSSYAAAYNTTSKSPQLNLQQLADVLGDCERTPPAWRIKLSCFGKSSDTSLFDLMPKLLSLLYAVELVVLTTSLAASRRRDRDGLPEALSEVELANATHGSTAELRGDRPSRGTVVILQNQTADHYTACVLRPAADVTSPEQKDEEKKTEQPADAEERDASSDTAATSPERAEKNEDEMADIEEQEEEQQEEQEAEVKHASKRRRLELKGDQQQTGASNKATSTPKSPRRSTRSAKRTVQSEAKVKMRSAHREAHWLPTQRGSGSLSLRSLLFARWQNSKPTKQSKATPAKTKSKGE